MSSRPVDDESPIAARRRLRIGYLDDHSAGVTYVIQTDREETWVVSRDQAICWPHSDPGRARSWALIVADWLEVDWPLGLTLLVNGREVRHRDLGVVDRITVEQRRTR